MKTGELYDICPDPLCEHNDASGCKYTSLSGIIEVPTDEKILYVTKTVYEADSRRGVLYFIDTGSGEMTELYSCDFGSDAYSSLTLSELTEEYLYFTETVITEVEVGEGKIEDSYREILMRLDLETRAVEEIAEFDKPFYVHYMDDRHMYFMDQDSKRIYRTDHVFRNEETVFDFSGMFENIAEYSIYGLTYDAESNSLWFGICTNYLSGLSTAMPLEEGHIYRVNIDTFEWEQVEMPSDKIMGFTLEGEYIYYTQYDPVSFGAGRVGDCVDETGNTICRVRLDNTAEPETVFDGHDEFFIADYFVMGDYIYLEYMQLVQGAGMSYFQNTGMTARVNFAENTIKWLEPNFIPPAS